MDLSQLIYPLTIMVHVIAVAIAVGTVTVVDYLHIRSFKNKSLEKTTLKVNPYLSQIIIGSLVLIILTGSIMVYLTPSFLQSSIFQLKLSLVAIIILNSIVLHKIVAPGMEKCILNPSKENCTKSFVLNSSFFGSLSIVTWYAIFILALTKHLGYTVPQFISAYIIVFAIAFFTAYSMEKHRVHS